MWPSSLQMLCMGCSFNQPIAGVVWLESLQKIYESFLFNQPIADVAGRPPFRRSTLFVGDLISLLCRHRVVGISPKALLR